MGLLNGFRNLMNTEIDIEVKPSGQDALFLNKEQVIQFIQEEDKKNKKKLIKNYKSDDVKTPLDEYYYDDMPIPQKYSVERLPTKVYDYAFNSGDGKYTLGITCFGKQSVAGYELDVCEIVHINNTNNNVSILENVMGVLDRKMLKDTHPYHKAYSKILMEKIFAESRLDRIITQNKGHFGMIKFNSDKKVFQLCTITPVIQKLNEIYFTEESKKTAIQLSQEDVVEKPKREWKRIN